MTITSRAHSHEPNEEDLLDSSNVLIPPRMVPIKLEYSDEVDFEYLVNAKKEVLPWLDVDVLELMMTYLPLEDMNRMSCTSKQFRNAVSVNMIVRAAMLKGGNVKASVDVLYPLIKARSIHPISPNGLWEILQTNKCVQCSNTTKRKKNNSVQFARKGIGLNLCWPCTRSKKVTSRFIKEGIDFEMNKTEWNIALDSGRTCNKRYGGRDIMSNTLPQLQWAIDRGIECRIPEGKVKDLYNYVLSEPYVNKNGEVSGPIVTAHHIPSLVSTLKEKFTIEEKLDAYDEFLIVHCNAADVDHQYYHEFVDAYESTKDIAVYRERERCFKMKMKSDEWRLKKHNNAVKLLKSIKNYMTDPQYFNLLTWRTNHAFMCGFKKPKEVNSPILMTTRWVNNYLQYYLSKPSKQKKGDIKLIAENLETLASGHQSDIDEDVLQSSSDILYSSVLLQDYSRRSDVPESQASRHRNFATDGAQNYGLYRHTW